MRKLAFQIFGIAVVSLCVQCTPTLFLGKNAKTVQYVRFPDQSIFIEDSSKARIYVARPTKWGGAIPITIRDNDFVVGHIAPDGYLCWERKPGQTRLKAKAGNTSTLDISLEKGGVYFVRLQIREFILTRTKLEEMTPDEGKELLITCVTPNLGNE